MFFLIPGGGGFFSILIIFLVIRLVFRSLFGGRSSYTHFYYDSNEDQNRYQRQYNSQSNESSQQRTYQPAKDYYSILGVTREASDDEVKKAYRKLIMEYHPDKVANNSNNDSKYKEFAAKRFREVQDAYEQICKARGIK